MARYLTCIGKNALAGKIEMAIADTIEMKYEHNLTIDPYLGDFS